MSGQRRKRFSIRSKRCWQPFSQITIDNHKHKEVDGLHHGVYYTPHQEQLYIEPQGVVAEFFPSEKRMFVKAACQCPYYVHEAIEIFYGSAVEKVEIEESDAFFEKSIDLIRSKLREICADEGFLLEDCQVNLFGECGSCQKNILRSRSMKLRDLKVGDKAKIVSYDTQDKAYRKKLLAMGLVKHKIFEVVRVAPMGDPVEILINNFNLTLRKKEADALNVEALS